MPPKLTSSGSGAGVDMLLVVLIRRRPFPSSPLPPRSRGPDTGEASFTHLVLPVDRLCIVYVQRV